MPAANRYTTTEFLASVRRKGHIPSSQTPFQDSDLLALADDEIAIALMSQVRTVREGFYKTYVDLPLNNSGLYDIPSEAIGGALDDVWILNGTQIFTVGRMESNEQFSMVSSPTGYWAFELIGNQIQIKPVPQVGVIRLWHMRRPNKLCTVASAAQITAIDTVGNVLTFSSLPSTFSTSSPLDCIQDQPHFNWNFIASTPTMVTSTTLTFSSLPVNQYGVCPISVGDWVALSGQSPVPQILAEFTPLLVQRTIMTYYEIQDYAEKLGLAKAKLEEIEKKIFELFNPRVSNEPKRIVPDANVIGGYRRWRAWRAT